MPRIPLKVFIVMALAVAVGLATAISPFASPSLDGLERVAEDKGFAEAAAPRGFQEDGSPIPDYAFPGVANERVATGLAGFTGTLVLFAVGFGLARLLQRGQRQRQEQTPPSRA
jgi:hypothetical protein